MSRVIELKKHADERGSLVVIQTELPFSIKRVFYIFNVPPSVERGGHRHKITQLALVCIGGSCEIHLDNGQEQKVVRLEAPTTCLLVEPEDFHIMRNFSPQSVLLVMASTEYNQSDYIYEAYNK